MIEWLECAASVKRKKGHEYSVESSGGFPGPTLVVKSRDTRTGKTEVILTTVRPYHPSYLYFLSPTGAIHATYPSTASEELSKIRPKIVLEKKRTKVGSTT